MSVNPWALEAFKRAESRRKEIGGISAVVEAHPGKAEGVASALRRQGYKVQGIVKNFVFVDLPTPADFDVASRLPNVRMVSAQKRMYPLALGIDEVFKRIAIMVDPLLSCLGVSDLAALGIDIRPAVEIPTPLQGIMNLVTSSIQLVTNPSRLMESLKGVPPVISRYEWRLVTSTRELMEVPSDNRLTERTYVGVIDTGVNPLPPIPPNPALGYPFIDYDCVSLTAEPPFDTMGHGSWVTSCAFGRRTRSLRYGLFIPVASAPSYLHVKVFTALGPCTSFQIMRAMELCAEKGCKVVNMSLGGPLQGSIEDDPECRLAGELYREYGTNFVVAVGNDGKDWSINSPAASPYVLSVGAIDWKTMETSSYSSRGPQGRWYFENKSAFQEDYEKFGDAFLKPDVAGIGGDTESQIVAVCTPWYDGLQDYLPDQWDMMTGTSMAAPHVAAPLALAIDREIVVTIDDLRSIMRRLAPSKNPETGYGLLRWTSLSRAP